MSSPCSQRGPPPHRFLSVETNVAMLVEYLDVRSLDSCACVCKVFHQVVTRDVASKTTWRALYLRCIQSTDKWSENKSNGLDNEDDEEVIKRYTHSLDDALIEPLFRLAPNLNYRQKARQVYYYLQSRRPFHVEEIRTDRNASLSGLIRRSGFVAAVFELPDLNGKPREIIMQFGGATDNYDYTNSVSAFECVPCTGYKTASSKEGKLVPPVMRRLQCRITGQIPSGRWLHCGAMTENNKFYVCGGATLNNGLNNNIKLELFLVTARIVRVKPSVADTQFNRKAWHSSSYEHEAQKIFMENIVTQLLSKRDASIIYFLDFLEFLSLVETRNETLQTDILVKYITSRLYCMAESLGDFSNSRTIRERLMNLKPTVEQFSSFLVYRREGSIGLQDDFEVVFNFSQLLERMEILGRFGHNMVYDSIRKRLVLFGGKNQLLGTQYNEVFYMDLSDPSAPLDWKHVIKGDIVATATAVSTATVDKYINASSSSGGGGGGGTTIEVAQPPVGPLEMLRDHPQFEELQQLCRSNATVVPQVYKTILDSLGDQDLGLRSVMFANYDAFVSLMTGIPRQAPPPPPGVICPSPRHCSSVAIVDREMILFGGWNMGDGNTFFNDMYALDLNTYIWRRVETSGIPPSPRCQSTMFLIGNGLNTRGKAAECGGGISDMGNIGGGGGGGGGGGSKGYLVVYGGAAQDSEQAAIANHVYGNVVIDYGDVHVFDLDTSCWLPAHSLASSICFMSRGGVNCCVELKGSFRLSSPPLLNSREFSDNVSGTTDSGTWSYGSSSSSNNSSSCSASGGAADVVDNSPRALDAILGDDNLTKDVNPPLYSSVSVKAALSPAGCDGSGSESESECDRTFFLIMGGMHSDPGAQMPTFKNDITFFCPDMDFFHY